MYFETPDYCIAFNAKVASAAIVRAIIVKHYPEIEAKIQRAHYPEGRGPDNTLWHWAVPHTKTPDKPVLLVVRDPVERFRSAIAFQRMDVVDVLDKLEAGDTQLTTRNVHFRRQVTLLQHGQVTKLYSFPEHLDAFQADSGLELQQLNETVHEKPDLTPEQLARVLAYYADDVDLFDSIVQPGQEQAAVPVAEDLGPAKAAAKQKAESDYQAAIAAGVTVNGITLAADDSSRARFVELATLLREAEGMADNPDFGDTPQVIADINGQPHNVTVTQLRGILVQYGLAIQSAWTARATMLAQIDAATTLAELPE